MLTRGVEELLEVRPIPTRRKRAARIRSGRTRGADNQNEWLLRLVDIGATMAAEGPTDVSANKHKYLADAYYTKSHPPPRR